MAITPIQPLSPAAGVNSIQPLRPSQKAEGAFDKMVGEVTKDFEGLQNNAADEVARLAAGKSDNVHQVMIALGKSEVAFNYMLEVRNRVLDSYKEIMRMPL